MKTGLFCSVLLVIGIVAMGCGSPQPPLPCSDDGFPDWRTADHWGDFDFQYCEEFDMVCNEAVTVAAECPAFMAKLATFIQERVVPILERVLRYLPWQIDLDRVLEIVFDRLQGVCGHLDILDRIGTCQPPGEAGDPCAEDADCLAEFTCLAGECG